jgi:hypothetical protein
MVVEPAREEGKADPLAGVPLSRRLLLLPHCLRLAEGCPGKMTPSGLDCSGCEHSECKIHAILRAAIEAGYENICVAPGGRLAVKRVAQTRPAAIVAVACDKELREGVAAVEALDWDGDGPPIIVQIPLLRDGCVNTDVDMAQVKSALGGPGSPGG